MDSQKRLLLALVLSFAVTTVYVFFLAPKADLGAAGLADAGVSGPATPQGGSTDSPSRGTAAPSLTPGGPLAAVGGQMPAEPPLREIVVDRATTRYTLTTQGGALTSAILQGAKTREQERVTLAQGWQRLLGKKAGVPPQMNLAEPPVGAPAPLSVSIEGSTPFSAQTRYEVESQTQRKLVLHARSQDWDVRKTLEWPEEGYELLYSLQIKNLSSTSRAGELHVYFSRAVDPKGEEAPSMFGGVGNQATAICRVKDSVHKRAPSNKPPEEYNGPLQFFGVDHQYFVSALFPVGGTPEARCVLEATPTQRVAVAAFGLSVPAGGSYEQKLGVYLGPKNIEKLSAVPSAGLMALEHDAGILAPVDPELEKTVDFGIWAVICKVLLFFLNVFHGWVRNWGVAIVLLTLLVKLLLLPLTHRSMVGMEAMKKLQPKVDAIRKRFADDKERQQQEMMKVYQEAKVNPFGSCFLMLVQMPVWIALYTTLRTSYELYGEPLLNPVWTDLTYKDPTYVLPILLGITMFVTSRLQPQAPGADPMQTKIMGYMPVLFAFLLLNTPAGLTLYMVTNNLLSIVQTYGLRKWLAGRPAAA